MSTDDLPDHAWYYTSEDQVWKILKRAQIEPAASELCPSAQPSVRFSLLPDWDPPPDAPSVDEDARARIGVPLRRAPRIWEAWREMSQCNDAEAEAIAKAVVDRGSHMRNFRATFKPAKEFLAAQRCVDGTWVDVPDWRKYLQSPGLLGEDDED
jgi:hypothetical protein